MQLTNLVVVAMVTTLPRQGDFYKFCFAHCIHQANLSFKTFMILESFTIMLSKCHHQTPDP